MPYEAENWHVPSHKQYFWEHHFFDICQCAFNDSFVNTDPKLASVIPDSTKTFQTFLPEINTVLNGTELTEKKFLKAFQSLKNAKCWEFDELHVNVIKPVYNKIKTPLMHVFRNSIVNGLFPKNMKLSRLHQPSKCVKNS